MVPVVEIKNRSVEICTDKEKKGCLKTAMLFYVLEAVWNLNMTEGKWN